MASGAESYTPVQLADSNLSAALYDCLDGRHYLYYAKVGRKMIEVQFLIRRILKEGHEYARSLYEDRSVGSNVERYYLNRLTAQIHLLQHLEREFLERDENDKQN